MFGLSSKEAPCWYEPLNHLKHNCENMQVLTLWLNHYMSRSWVLMKPHSSQRMIQHLSIEGRSFNREVPKQQTFTMCLGIIVQGMLEHWIYGLNLDSITLPHEWLCFQIGFSQSALQMSMTTLQQSLQFASCHNYIVQGAFPEHLATHYDCLSVICVICESSSVSAVHMSG